MTEQEWLECTDPEKMLEFLQGKASDRKLRLFACACCRRFWHLLVDSRSQQAVETSERFADALVGRGELARAAEDARSAGEAVARQIDPEAGFDAARAAQFTCALPMKPLVAEQLARNGVALTCAGPGLSAAKGERQAQADLLRDVFGNSFRPVVIEPTWLVPTVTSIATAAYEERLLPSGEFHPARLAVLADALEEAGCTNSDILAHCRDSGPHTRGCWAVDALLSKT
jgi:hypothetical protein